MLLPKAKTLHGIINDCKDPISLLLRGKAR